MIFVGDVSISIDDHFLFKNVPKHMLTKSQEWCINLEGPVLQHPIDDGLYNGHQFIKCLDPFNITHAFIANNHIKDHRDGISLSIKFLRDRDITPVGVDVCSFADLDLRGSPSDVLSRRTIVLGYGSELIGCSAIPDKTGSSILLLREDEIVEDLSFALNKANGRKVFICLHANYELDRAPQPSHRDFSRRLIDLGADGVIFHHSHVVGFVETYKNKVICYGVGNWAASREKFLGGQLKYPTACNNRIALEINGNNDMNVIHHFIYKEGGDIMYESSENVADEKCSLLAPFQNYSSTDYVKWYKNNRRKSLFLPMFVGKDSTKLNILKKHWVLIRQELIKLVVKIGLKKATPSEI